MFSEPGSCGFVGEKVTERIDQNDPGFLLSRSIDGELTQAESARLETLLAGSEELRRQQRQLHGLAKLLRGWARVAPQIDWTAHLALSRETVKRETESDDKLDAVDALLVQWGKSGAPEIDLRAAVLRRISRRDVRRRGWILRFGLPLAAAAAIAISLIPLRETSDVPMDAASPVAVVLIGPGTLESRRLMGEPPTTVVFDRASGAVAQMRAEVGFVVVQSPPTARVTEEAAPL